MFQRKIGFLTKESSPPKKRDFMEIYRGVDLPSPPKKEVKFYQTFDHFRSNFTIFGVKFYHLFDQIFGHFIPFPIGMYRKKDEYGIWSTPLGKIPIKSVFGGASLSSQIRAQIWHKISISEGKATIDGRKCSSTILHECKKKNEMV